MKLLKQSFEKDKSGLTTVIPQDKEDLWQLYNLIQKGDEVKLATTRNVKKSGGTGGGSGAGKSERVHLTLKLLVEDIDYTPSDDALRIRGKTIEQNEYVPNNSYHTAEIQLNKQFTLHKPEWDEISYGIIVKACAIEEKADIGAVVMEEGVAHICLVTDTMTVLRNKIEKLIPRKRRGEGGGVQYDKAVLNFYDMVTSTMLRNFDYSRLKVIILASPGFTANALYKHLMTTAAREMSASTSPNTPSAVLLANKSKFMVVHTSTGYLHGLEEVLNDPSIQSKLRDTQFAREAAIFDEFQRTLNNDDDRAWYGPSEATKAAELGAVKYLLITDTLFRSDDLAVRKHYIQLGEQIKESGGEVLIFSSLHESGEQLNQLTGVAVLLNYPVADLDEDEA